MSVRYEMENCEWIIFRYGAMLVLWIFTIGKSETAWILFFAVWFHPGGGGGGEHFHICMHIKYVQCERLPFSALNFRSGAYYLHKWQKYSAPETIIFKISLRSSRSSRAHGRLTTASPKAFVQRPGVSGWPECRPDASYSQFRRPPLSCSSLLRSPTFSCSSSLRRPPFFATAHTYQNLGWVPPPPPPDLIFQTETACKFKMWLDFIILAKTWHFL